MIKAVVDTNIIVSALLSPSGSPAKVLDYILNENVVVCYDSRIITEYREVLYRPKFGFDKKLVDQVIDFITFTGVSIVPVPLSVNFEDGDDKIFYEVAKASKAYLVTGNMKHFPVESLIVEAKKFLSIVDNTKKY